MNYNACNSFLTLKSEIIFFKLTNHGVKLNNNVVVAFKKQLITKHYFK